MTFHTSDIEPQRLAGPGDERAVTETNAKPPGKEPVAGRRETMEFPPLPRHEGLQPFSREHFNGLRHARQLVVAAEQGPAERASAASSFMMAWREEIRAHFDDEERLLRAVVREEDRQRLVAEHEAIRGLAVEFMGVLEEGKAPAPELLERMGRLLHDHIRWEERHLFETVQQRASDEQMLAIADETAKIEAARPGARKRGADKRRCRGGCNCGKKQESPPTD
jgi:hemerythrin